jgi:tripartite ATP-independent transporter DctM subunit
MGWTEALTIYGLTLIGCIAGGVGIGASMGLVGMLGITLASGTLLWPTFGDIVWNTTTNFSLVSIPLFILMGELILQSGISGRFYSGIAGFFRRVPGGLAQTNIAGCAIFSAIAGSSVATALTVGTVAIKEMRARGYADTLTLGTLTAGGCLGILIPPSIPLIVYGSMTQESVIDLFMAGIAPGVLLALIFAVYVGIRVAITPGLVPKNDDIKLDTMRSIRDSFPILFLIAAVIGGMYAGVVTPTEASGFGCLIALVLALLYRDLSWPGLRAALINTVLTSAVIMFIVINAQILNFAIVSSGIGRGLAGWLSALQVSPFVFFCILLVIYLIIGMFIDGLSIMLLTVPLLYPSFAAMGFNGVWVGIILVVFIELGALTPPMGLNLFAIQSIAPGKTLAEVAVASLPYCILIVAFSFLLYAFPDIALWLPAALK